MNRLSVIDQVIHRLDGQKAVLAIVGPNTLELLAQHVVTPIVPIYVLEMGGDVTAVALILSAFALGHTLAAGWMGGASDVLGRKTMVLIGCGGSAIAQLACGAAPLAASLIHQPVFTCFAAGRLLLGLFAANDAVAGAFLVDVCDGPKALSKASSTLAIGNGVANILGPLVGAAVLFLADGRSAAVFFVAAALAIGSMMAAAAFQLTRGDVAMLELRRMSAEKRTAVISAGKASQEDYALRRKPATLAEVETTVQPANQPDAGPPAGPAEAFSMSKALRREATIVSAAGALRISHSLLTEGMPARLSGARVTMIAMTTLGSFCLRTGLVAMMVILPVHAIEVVPHFTGSSFGLLLSFTSILGVLCVSQLMTRLQQVLGNGLTNALLAALMALANLFAAAMRAGYGRFNWLLLLGYCLVLGPSIFGHVSACPPALAKWATPDTRGFVISLGTLSGALSQIVMPLIFSAILQATSAAFAFLCCAAFAACSAIIFCTVELATDDRPAVARIARTLLGGLSENDPIFQTAAEAAKAAEHLQPKQWWEESFGRTSSPLFEPASSDRGSRVNSMIMQSDPSVMRSML